MKVTAYIEREKKEKTIELNGKSSVRDVLKELHINPVTVIVTKNNELVTEDHQLQDKDTVKVISVVSGG